MSDTPKDDEEITLSAEVIDRAERKALKKKQKEKEAAKKIQLAQDEIEASLAHSKLAEAKKKKKKKIFKGVGALGVLGFFTFAVFYLFAPYKAGITFGICKTFLELYVQFPKDLRISTVDDLGQSLRIWYTQVDAFGEYRMENIHCYYRADEVTGAAVDRITVNRREVDPQRVADFNRSLPVIINNPPDLTIPYPLPDSLENLQIETDRFRFQLNLPGR